jgi:hypothetical protein
MSLQDKVLDEMAQKREESKKKIDLHNFSYVYLNKSTTKGTVQDEQQDTEQH